MKRKIAMILLAMLAVCVQRATAQEKAKSEDPAATAKDIGYPKPVTPLRVQVVFSEYESEKKISSLPYTLLVNADDRGPIAAVRMGLRVPVVTGSSGENKQFQYLDIGTNLDGRAERTDDGRFFLKLNVERSSAYTPDSGQKNSPVTSGQMMNGQPVIQRFSAQVNLVIRDGQTIQSTVATDPVTGHVLKVDVTANVVK